MNKKVDLSKVKKILVIKFKHIGDVLLMVPTVRALRERFPKAHIACLVNKGTEEMLTGNPLIDEILTLDRSIKKLPKVRKIIESLKWAKSIKDKRFDLVVDLGEGDRGAVISFISGAKIRASFDVPEEKFSKDNLFSKLGHLLFHWHFKGKGTLGRRFLFTHLARPKGIREHTIEHDLNVVRNLGIDTENKELEVFVSDEDQRDIESLLKEKGIKKEEILIIIHPVSRWKEKEWRDEGFARACDYLIGKYHSQVIFTSGPEERETRRVKEIISLMKKTPIDLSGKLSLKQLVALIKRSDFYLGLDSAPMHIASAFKKPLIALFDPTSIPEWAPRGKNQIAFSVRTGIDEIIEALDKELSGSIEI
jgi:heptosyltransferase-3